MVRTAMTRTTATRTRYGLTDLLSGLVLGCLALLTLNAPAAAQMTGDANADRRRSYYVTGDGAIGLVLDRTGPRTVLRFENSDRAVVLRSQPAGRGDLLMRNERGDVVLRLTSFGPATYFPNGDLRGVPVSRTSRYQQHPDRRGAPASQKDVAALEVDAKRHAAQASIALGGSVIFDGDWTALPKTGTETLAEAIANVGNALDNLAKEPDLSDTLADRLNRVRFEEKTLPGLRRDGGTLYVDIADAPGLDGRPSSASIMSFLRDTH
ncbi:MAG: DUF4908 domain-containing protein [Alphaproteobacteria bacterium]